MEHVGDLAVAELFHVLQVDRCPVALGERGHGASDLLGPAAVEEQELDALRRAVAGEQLTLERDVALA